MTDARNLSGPRDAASSAVTGEGLTRPIARKGERHKNNLHARRRGPPTAGHAAPVGLIPGMLVRRSKSDSAGDVRGVVSRGGYAVVTSLPIRRKPSGQVPQSAGTWPPVDTATDSHGLPTVVTCLPPRHA